MKKTKKLYLIPLIISIVCLFIPTAAKEVKVNFEPGWQMIALPYQPEGEISVCERFGADRVFGVGGEQYIDCSGLGSWNPGRGIWAYVEKPFEFKFSGVPISEQDPFSIELEKGWNIVGNPFLFPIAVDGGITIDGVPFNDSDAVRSEIYGYKPAEKQYEKAEMLDPWRGYLIYANRSARLQAAPVRVTEKPGKTVELRILTGTGSDTGEIDLSPGETVTLKAAGYDAQGRFTGYLPASWSAEGGISVAASGFVEKISLKYDQSGISGKIKAAVGDLSATTGLVTVLGAGSLYEYPFNENSQTINDIITGVEEVAGQLVVAFKGGTSLDKAKQIIEDAGGRIVGYNETAGIFQIKSSIGTIAACREAIEKAPELRLAAPNVILKTGGFPNDAEFVNVARRWGYEKIRMNEVWGAVVPAGAPVIALIDTGIDANHPDLINQIIEGHNFVDPAVPSDVSDQSGHGTAVAGVIAAKPDNGLGIAGVCGSCKIMPLKVCDAAGSCPIFSVANAITYAADHGVEVINISLGAYLDPASSSAGLLGLVVNDAATKGAFIVGAAGNDNKDSSNYYPAALPIVLSTAATDQNDNRAAFSNYGPRIQISAPGTDIYTTLPLSAGGYGFRSGTSISAGYVSGLAGLILSLRSSLQPMDVTNLIQATMQPVVSSEQMSGRLDAAQLVNYFGHYNTPPAISKLTRDAEAIPLNATVNLHAEASDPDGDMITYTWIASDGTILPSGPDAVWTAPANRGSFKIEVVVSDSFGNKTNAQAYVAVLNGPIKSVKVAPAMQTVYAGAVIQYNAECLDEDAMSGMAPPVACEATWALIGDVGTLDAKGGFAATAPGDGYVTAMAGVASGYTKVSVLAANGGVLNTAAADTPCDSVWGNIRCNDNGTNAAVNPLYSKLTTRWQAFIGSGMDGQAISSGGNLYFGDNRNMFHCLRQVDGSACWPAVALDFNTGGFSNAATFSSDGNFIYIAGLNGYLYKVSTAGVLDWKWTPTAPGESSFLSAPVVRPDAGGDVIVLTSHYDPGGPSRGRIFAVQDTALPAPAHPVLKWAYPDMLSPAFQNFGPSSPIYANIGGQPRIIATNRKLNILDFNTGLPIAGSPFACGGQCTVTPTIADFGGNTYLYLPVDDKFKKFDPVSGLQLWETPAMETILAPGAYSNGVFYVATRYTSKIYAIRDTVTGPSFVWGAPAQPTRPGTVYSAVTVYPAGTPVSDYPAGLIFTSYNLSDIGTVNLATGNVMWEMNPDSNITASPIIMKYGSDFEAYYGDNNGYFRAMERNFPPIITSFNIEPFDELFQTIDPDGVSHASATLFVTDQNGLDDLLRATVDLTPIGGSSAVLLAQDPVNFGKFATPTALSKIIPQMGVAPGYATITVTVYDKGGLFATATDRLIIANTAPSIISATFSPTFIYPNGVETSLLTAVIQDRNNTLGATGYVKVDVSALQGGGPPNWQSLTCGAFNASNQATCTATVTAAAGTTLGAKNLNVQVYDETTTVTGPPTANITVVGVDHFALVAAPASLSAGASSTVQITAYCTPAAQIVSYNNTAPINITTTAATGYIEYSGTGVTDLHGGNATLAIGSFSSGVATVKISDTKVEANVKVHATDSGGKTGASNGITWTPGLLDHFALLWTNPSPPIAINDNAIISVTAYDFYNNIVTGYTNPNGLNLTYVAPGPASPATLAYSANIAGSITNLPGTGGATLKPGYFTNGVSSFKVTDTFADSNIVFRATDAGPNKTGTSDPVTWNSGTLTSFDFAMIDPAVGNPTAGATATLKITARDQFGGILTTYNNVANVILSRNTGTAATTRWGGNGVINTGPGTATLAAGEFVFGSATVQIRNTTAEAQQVQMQEFDAPLPNISKTLNITWDVGPLQHFHASAAPVSTLVGNNVTITLTAKDAFDNTVLTFANPNGIKLSQIGGTASGFVWSGPGVTPDGAPGYTGTLTGNQFVNGVDNTIQVKDNISESGVKIVATENVTLFTGQSQLVDWTTGPLADFKIVAAPTARAAGESTVVTVTAYDNLGNVKTDYSSNVRLTAMNGTLAMLTWSGTGVTPGAPGIATLAGTRFVSGIATAALTHTLPEGPIILRVDNLGAIASQSAVINSPTWTAGPLHHFDVAANPLSVLSGDTVDLTITARDLYNNLITAYSNPNGLKLSQTGGTASGFTWIGAGITNDGAPLYRGTLTGNQFVNGVAADVHVSDSIVNLGVRIVVTENVSGI
ncbi:MAG: S8 family serine peptidase, partial [bacterium]